MAYGERIQPLEQYGVKLMSMGFLNPGDKPLVWRGPMLHSVIQQFLRGVDWGELDYLVIDLPPGTGDVQLSLIQTAPITGAIVVTTPSDVSLEDARKAIHMFHQVRVPILGIVENMSYLHVPALQRAHRRVQSRRRTAHRRRDGGAFSGRAAARSAGAHRRRHRQPRGAVQGQMASRSWNWPATWWRAPKRPPSSPAPRSKSANKSASRQKHKWPPMNADERE